jgi:hypothetical protein
MQPNPDAVHDSFENQRETQSDRDPRIMHHASMNRSEHGQRAAREKANK